MATSSVTTQQAAKAALLYGDDKPEWMRLALKAINQWGRQEYTLAHAVALALEDAYARGERVEYPTLEAPRPPRLVGRQRPQKTTETAEKTATLMRRKR